MSQREYRRKKKESQPVRAICYDFDKTLSPDDMQAQGYIQSVGCDIGDFWKESNALADDNDMDQNLAYMYKMMTEADGRIVFNKERLRDYGSKVKLFPGVEEWFERIKAYGKEHGVLVEHYIISSGLKEMIEGTSVARAGAFEEIYASSFFYENDRSAKWPAQVVNYTNKTQFLFRIEKGVPEINDQSVNDFFEPEDVRVPFRNFVYIGDSDTDIPCMKLVHSHGGHSIGVYDPETNDKAKVYKMMRENRISFFAAANYTENSELDQLIKAIIDKTEAAEKLERIHQDNKQENIDADKQTSEEEKRKTNLLIELEDSYNYARTHEVIAKMSDITDWSDEQATRIASIANENSQVRGVILDVDVKKFMKRIKRNHPDAFSAYPEIDELIN